MWTRQTEIINRQVWDLSSIQHRRTLYNKQFQLTLTDWDICLLRHLYKLLCMKFKNSKNSWMNLMRVFSDENRSVYYCIYHYTALSFRMGCDNQLHNTSIVWFKASTDWSLDKVVSCFIDEDDMAHQIDMFNKMYQNWISHVI